MSPTLLICLALVASFCGMSSAQAVNRYRTVVPMPGPAINNPCDDLCTLIQLANALNGQSSGGSSSKSSGLNVDDIISKLINALIATTVGQGSSGGSGGSGGGSGGGSSKDSNPVIALNLLGPNGLLAGLGLGGTEVLDVVAGGSSPQSGLNGLLKNVVGGL